MGWMGTAKMAADLAQLAERFERRGDDDSWKRLRDFGEALNTVGGNRLMVGVYDRAIEQCGYASLPGVAECWHGIDGWAS